MTDPIEPITPPEDDFPETWDEEPRGRPANEPESLPLNEPTPLLPG